MANKGIRNKLCPLLEGLGVFEADPAYGVEKNWIKEICRECPLEEGCIYDRAGRISREDREELLKQLTKKLEEMDNESKGSPTD